MFENSDIDYINAHWSKLLVPDSAECDFLDTEYKKKEEKIQARRYKLGISEPNEEQSLAWFNQR